jgi:hypothetical protein
MISILLFSFAESGRPEPACEIRIENLQSTVLYLTGIQPPRSYDHPESLGKAVNFISDKFREYSLDPQIQAFSARGRIYENVIASLGPRDRKRLIIGPYYDVAGHRPGADDNASGVAGLLEIARSIKEFEPNLSYRVDLVAYALEEPPFFSTDDMGSYIHAKSLKDNDVDVKGMISLEAIGFFTDEKCSQSFPVPLFKFIYPDTGNFIALVSNVSSALFASEIQKHMKNASFNAQMLTAPASVRGVDLSDHSNYWKFGYNAVMITDTAFFRNPHYHRASDTADTLDYDRMAKVVQGICRSVLGMK